MKTNNHGFFGLTCRIVALAALLNGTNLTPALAVQTSESTANVQTESFSSLVPTIAQSSPADGSTDAAPSQPISLHFNQAVDPESLTADSVTLLGPEGAVAAAVKGVGDASVVLTPRNDLFPTTRYTVFVKGVTNTHGVPIALTTITFTTAALTPAAQDPRVSSTTPPSDANASSSADPSATAPMVAADSSIGGTSPTTDLDRWQPSSVNRNGNWRTGRPLPPAIALRRNEARTPQSLAPGGKVRVARVAGTAVTGIILRQSDQPLANVKVSIGAISAMSGSDGEFVLQGLKPGQQELIVDGRSAGDVVTTQYGYFVIGVNVVAGKDTEVEPVYLPKIIQSDWVPLPSPIIEDTIVRTPAVPGMEIHIPKGTVLRDREGKLVTQIALVPMPLDRMPFSFPENAPVYVGVQPAGMIVQGLTPGATAGITVHYPNQTNLPAGTSVDFWSYNTDARGWQIYGNGTVSSDAKAVTPNAGIALYESIGFMYTPGNPPPPPDAPPPDSPGDDPPDNNNPPPSEPDDPPPGSGNGGSDCDNASDGDPVDCKSGLFVLDRRDAKAHGIIPISVTRTFRAGDPTVRAFGYGANHGYAMYLRDPLLNGSYQQYDLILPNGSFVRFNRTSPPGGYTDVVAVYNDSASDYYGAILDYESGNYVVTKKNGTKYIFSLYGTLDAIRDRHGNTVTVTRNGGQIQRLTAAGGRYVDFTYDASNRITQMTDIAGRTWGYTYSPDGYLTRVTYPDGLHEDYTYDTSGHMLSINDRKGNTIVTNSYDANGRVDQQILADGHMYHFAYTLDANGKVTRTDVTDPNGHIKRVTYDSHGYKASITKAYNTSLQQTTTYERDATSGLLMAIVDALGRRTEMQRDGVGNVTQQTWLAGTANAVTQSYTYDPVFSQLTSYTDRLGKTTTLGRDAVGNLTSVTDPLSHTTNLTYNTAGQVLTTTDPLGHKTQFTYDPTGDRRSVTDALNRIVTYYIDGLGRDVGVVDPLGRKSLWTYDAMGRVVTSTDPLGQMTTMAYDGNGNLTDVTDPNGGNSHFGYDGRNRRQSRRDALNQTESWTFDGMSNAVTYTDRKSQTTNYQYDALDRRRLATYADASTVAASYDLVDRLLQLDDSVSGTIVRTYDGLNRLSQEQTPQGTVSYIYDAVGRRTQMTAASQLPITYGYDDADRLTSIVQGSETVGYGYDDADRRTSLTLPNAVATAYNYDAANQLSSITYKKGTTTLGSLAYTYDAGGQRITQTGTFAGDKLPNATTGSNVFDLNNRQTQANGFAVSYDANGDPTSNTTPTATSYTFDVRHRLVQMAQGGNPIASFQYDALGRRTSKTIGAATTTFLYDGDNPIQETQGTTINAILTGLEIDERYARSESNGRRYFLADAIDSTVALTDTSGATTQTYNYEPYGAVQTSGTSTNPYQYTGRENDGTGLYYYRKRYYSPNLKRFISEDSIELLAGLNSYIYAINNPVSGIDQFGLDVIFVGNPHQQQQLINSYNQISTTNIGRDVQRHLEQPGTDYIINPNTDHAYYDPSGHIININPDDNPSVPTGGLGSFPSPTDVIMFHEFGHAMGEKDDGLGNMNNVNKYENPYRRERGLPCRTGY